RGLGGGVDVVHLVLGQGGRGDEEKSRSPKQPSHGQGSSRESTPQGCPKTPGIYFVSPGLQAWVSSPTSIPLWGFSPSGRALALDPKGLKACKETGRVRFPQA